MVQTTTISLRVSLNRKKNGLNLEATTKFINKQSKRHYHLIEGLKNPCFDCWDKRKQQFTNVTTDSVYNNELLIQLLSKYRELANTGMFSDGNELFSHNINEPVREKTPTTLGEFLKDFIYQERHQKSKMPSCNYQKYINLLHKLELEGNLINIPLLDFNNQCFIKFSDFILNKLDGVNYNSLMVLLKSTLNKARVTFEDMPNITFKFREHAPKNADEELKKAIEGIKVLTVKQYKKFCELDLNTVEHGNNMQVRLMELYRDFCIFLYEIKSRPESVIKMHRDNIKGNRLIYYAGKKKNYTDGKDIVNTPITPIASKIIKKYEGQSSKGYIFPFAMNEYDWNFKNSASFNKWYNRKSKTLEQINDFLHKLEPILKTEDLTSYVFRHSTFTHKIKEGYNILQLAKEGGTSVEILEEHYYNHII